MANVEAEKEMLEPNVLSNMVSQNFHCNEVEERRMKADVRCGELEFELQKKKDQCEALEAKVKTLEEEKFAVEEELKVLRMLSEKERVIKVDLPEDDNEAVQLMIENKVLECEKIKAESEVEVWKEKYKNLETWALQLGMRSGSNQRVIEGNLHLYTRFDEKGVDLGNVMQSAGTPPCGIFHRSPKVQPRRKVRKLLTFETEETPGKTMAPSTPIGPISASIDVIDIIDSGDGPNITHSLAPDRQGSGNIFLSTCFSADKENNFVSNYARNNDKNLDVSEEHAFASTLKRKWRCNVVVSSSESDHDVGNMRISKSESESEHDDDNMRISKSESVMTRHRLRLLRKCVSKSLDDKPSSSGPHKVKHEESIPTKDDAAAADESEDDSSHSEGGNMSNFIVNDSDVSNSEDSSSKLQDESNSDVGSLSSNSQDLQDSNEDYDSQDVSDGDMDFGKIISKFHRRKKNKMMWEFEADMLAAFGKDSELCMKAVCALYRQQTSEEKVSKEALCHNRRGFSKFHAYRGSTLAEFLTDGDPRGALRKTVKDLQGYDAEAVEHCRSLAIHYSKQLYQIYVNKEDPFFP